MKKRAVRNDPNEHTSLVEVLHALADPVRLEIVRQLHLEGEKACGTFALDRAKSSLSHHFSVLRQTGIIQGETQGTVIMNRLRSKELDARFPGLLQSVLAAAKRGG
ncbi:ArsR/SmtB family transcription factor [Granulicella cerasi]|uniref:ArsR/SmtB family transcription factor n=1 Tax=Granulicella cerasi TaxID=741063 RepID=A0ABW1ZBJ3_9BACT|nr:helix-turn-helix domain-containing protein [Granulicella cerasi]